MIQTDLISTARAYFNDKFRCIYRRLQRLTGSKRGKLTKLKPSNKNGQKGGAFVHLVCVVPIFYCYPKTLSTFKMLIITGIFFLETLLAVNYIPFKKNKQRNQIPLLYGQLYSCEIENHLSRATTWGQLQNQ